VAVIDDAYSRERELRRLFASLNLGLKGLYNLGNTCYMNSILQSLSSTPVLTRHFLTDRYVSEINVSNPLGMGGKVAVQFGALMKQLWSPGGDAALSPSSLKEVIGKFRPQFQGSQQHDSQELLAFLLDGLHEDLNRITQKPYVENPEFTTQTDEEFSAICWHNYKQRNDSVIVDHFQGQLKSKLVCQVCGRVSTTFDPFMYLSVPIPAPKRVVSVVLVEKDSYNFPVRYSLKVPRQGTVADVMKELSRLSSLDRGKLLLTEVYRHKFQRIFREDDNTDTLPAERDVLYAYEVATNDDLDPQFALVPVVLRVLGSNPLNCNTCGRGTEGRNPIPLKRCGKCKEVGYCSEECQRSDWDAHKRECRAFFNPFGVPFLLSVPRQGTTPKQLYLKIWGSLRRYIAFQKEKNPSSATLFARPQALFTLKYMEGAKINTAVEESEEPLDFDYSVIISADWEWKEQAGFFGEALARPVEDHASMAQPAVDTPVGLKDCIRLFSEEELLEDSDSWFCPGCKLHQPAKKQLTLWSLPEILVVHLKRFASKKASGHSAMEGLLSRYGLLRDKLTTLVEFPLGGLDLGDLVSHHPGGRRPLYDLYAVSNHYGGTYGGHYTGYCLREGVALPPGAGGSAEEGASEDWWFKFDDSAVSPLSPEEVQSPAAYVLFFKRRE